MIRSQATTAMTLVNPPQPRTYGIASMYTCLQSHLDRWHAEIDHRVSGGTRSPGTRTMYPLLTNTPRVRAPLFGLRVAQSPQKDGTRLASTRGRAHQAIPWPAHAPRVEVGFMQAVGKRRALQHRAAGKGIFSGNLFVAGHPNAQRP